MLDSPRGRSYLTTFDVLGFGLSLSKPERRVLMLGQQTVNKNSAIWIVSGQKLALILGNCYYSPGIEPWH